MIDALINGKLIRDPAIKTGKSGNPYANFMLSVPVGDESPVMVSGIGFGDVAERIAKLRKGDALSVVGSLKPSTWLDKATGETRHGLNVTAQAALSPYDVKKRREGADAPAKPINAPRAGYGHDGGFNDAVEF
jgi:single-stranded DNA-binding protein